MQVNYKVVAEVGALWGFVWTSPSAASGTTAHLNKTPSLPLKMSTTACKVALQRQMARGQPPARQQICMLLSNRANGAEGIRSPYKSITMCFTARSLPAGRIRQHRYAAVEQYAAHSLNPLKALDAAPAMYARRAASRCAGVQASAPR